MSPSIDATDDSDDSDQSNQSNQSDHRVIAEVTARVSVPRQDEADSFVLHAPLEILARTALLPYVTPAARPLARERLAEIGPRFDAFGAAVGSAAAIEFADEATAAAILVAAIGAGELDDVDAAASWLGRHTPNHRLPALLADAVIPSLAAAAHAPIFFWLLPRVSPRTQASGGLLRPLARELARHPQWRLTWFEAGHLVDDHPTVTGPTTLWSALANTPQLGAGPSNYIYPTMARIDTAELAGALLGPALAGSSTGASTPAIVAEQGRTIMRTAAWSMLGEPPDEAPYGWSHALTMSQAVIGIAQACADPRRAMAVAATFVFGFRASLAARPLIDGFTPEQPPMTLGDALSVGPDEAAAAAWHCSPAAHSRLVTEIATRAATHPDAHLAKYVLACLDAIEMDPGATRLYVTAAAKLVGYWAAADRVSTTG